MNYLSESTQQTVFSPLHAAGKYLFAAVTAAAILCTVSWSESEAVELEVDPDFGQAVFVTPEDAAKIFVGAVENNDEETLGKVLGTDYLEVLPLDEVDSNDVESFLAAWKKHHTLLPDGNNKRLLAVGDAEWTLPIPIAQGTSGWYFDIAEGLERMRIRRIGRNELATIQAVLAYYDAQMEYAQQDRNGDGVLEYAQRFLSTPGQRDGLYWENKPDDAPSPLGPSMADHEPGGGYHGYYYRILDAQGEDAADGAYSYLIGNQMRAGFAVIAWPIEYGESGVMSFMVSHAGIVYEKDLGPDSASIAQQMPAFDPGPGWTPTQVVNDLQPGVGS